MSYEGNPFAVAEAVRMNGNVGAVSYGSDKKLMVRFFKEPIYMEAQSVKDGKAVYQDFDYIEIITPGMRGATIKRQVKVNDDGGEPPDTMRWPTQWAQFQKQQEQVSEGMRLEEWAPMTKSEVMNCKAQNIHTVEQVANMTDDNLGVLGLYGRRRREEALNFLKQAQNGAASSQLISENEILRRDLNMLKEQVQTMKGKEASDLAQELTAAKSEIAALKDQLAARKKPGPKPKKSTTTEGAATDGH